MCKIFLCLGKLKSLGDSIFMRSFKIDFDKLDSILLSIIFFLNYILILFQ